MGSLHDVAAAWTAWVLPLSIQVGFVGLVAAILDRALRRHLSSSQLTWLWLLLMLKLEF